MLGHTAFFLQHGLALDNQLYLMLFKDLDDDLIVLSGIPCPVDLYAMGECVCLKLFKVLIEMSKGAATKLPGSGKAIFLTSRRSQA